MTFGDTLQSIIAAIGVLATLFVAWMVLRLERRDSRIARREDRTEAAGREQQRQSIEEERANRARRYEHHRDDYRAAVEALDELEESLQEIWNGKPSVLDTGLIDEPADILERLSRRLPELSQPLMNVAEAGKQSQLLLIGLDKSLFLDVWESDEDGGTPSKDLRKFMHLRRMIRDSILLDRTSRVGLDAIAKARTAISKEWGDRKDISG